MSQLSQLLGRAETVVRPPDYGRFLLHGPQGAGKTTLASSIATLGRTLFLDMVGEQGTRSFQGAAWESNITVFRPTSVTELDDVYYALAAGGHGYTAVVIDSLTSVQKSAMRFLTGAEETAVREIKRGTAPTSIQQWGQSLTLMTDVATFWYGLADGTRAEPMHVVMTAQTKVNEDEVSGSTRRQPDVQKGALSMLLAAPDYVLYCDLEDNPMYGADAGQPAALHIVRFGPHPGYATKARVPVDLRGRIPSVLGRDKAVTLGDLSRVLRVGGTVRRRAAAPADSSGASAGTPARPAAAKPAAATTTSGARTSAPAATPTTITTTTDTEN